MFTTIISFDIARAYVFVGLIRGCDYFGRDDILFVKLLGLVR